MEPTVVDVFRNRMRKTMDGAFDLRGGVYGSNGTCGTGHQGLGSRKNILVLSGLEVDRRLVPLSSKDLRGDPITHATIDTGAIHIEIAVGIFLSLFPDVRHVLASSMADSVRDVKASHGTFTRGLP